jgi:isoquinoline 1-oxidoreductase beta subunit
MAERKKRRISRREFLIATGVAGAGLVVAVRLGIPSVRVRLAEFLEASAGPPGSIDAEPTAWFEIGTDGRVKIFIPKTEMGQGVHTSLAQIAAEELEIAWQDIEVVQAGTGQGLNDSFGTGASNSVSSLWKPLREAGAIMREVLRVEAARQLGVSATILTAREGFFSLASDPQTQITYGQVVQNAGEWEIPDEVPPLKPSSQFQLIGKPLPRVDLEAKILGQAEFGFDKRLPGMAYGAVARPPTINGTLRQARSGGAKSVPGVIEVVIQDGFAGVVAESRLQAIEAVNAMDTTWDEGQKWDQKDIEKMVRVGIGERVVIQKEGNVGQILDQGDLIQAEYRTPLAFHAHLEPQAALADVGTDKVTVWTSTQFPVRVQGLIAETLDIDQESVVVMPTYLGGGFGRKIGEEAALEAVRLSQAAGVPVHVGWTREEDFQHGFLRPPTHHVLQASLAAGQIEAMEHQQASGEVSFPFLPGFMKAALGADFGAWRGAFIQYDIPHRQTVAYLASLPVPTGWWRGLGLMANVFAIESFVDELAVAAGADPLEFRLEHLPQTVMGDRIKRALETAAERSGWGSPSPAGHGRGVALSVDVSTIAVEVAEVSVEEGQIRVHQVTAVIDPGLVVNPDGARAQTEGAITMGLSSTLVEEVTIKQSVLQANNFNSYPLLTMADAPDIDVVLLESGDTPSGMGEPPIGPIAAAVSNAVHNLTGERIRKLPLRFAG